MKVYQDIKKGIIAPLYLFYGEEKYKIRVYKKALMDFVPYGDKINYSYFEGKSIDFQQVYEMALTLPFFAEKRLIIVENSGCFAGKKKKSDAEAETEEKTESSSDQLIEKILEEIPDTTCLAFFESDVLRTKKIYKKIAGKGVAEPCSADSPEDVKKWIRKGFRSFKKEIEPRAVDLIVERVGTEYTVLLNEIEKLVSYSEGDGPITTADVMAVTTHNIESKIFDILSFMCARNTEGVLNRYYDLLANQEEPRMILAMIRRQFRIMLQTAELAEKGLSDAEIAGITKNKPFVIKKMRSYLRNYSKSEILQVLDEINDIDMQTKNGNLDPQIAVELVLFR